MLKNVITLKLFLTSLVFKVPGGLITVSLIPDFSNQNACGNVSKISVNHADDIPYMAVHFVPALNSSKMVKCMKI